MATNPETRSKQPIENWWAAFPMTYGHHHGTPQYEGQGGAEDYPLGSREFFERVDQTFYSWNVPLHDQSGKFSRIFPYAKYRDKQVLEIGCGMGTMAMNWASHGAHITAADLNLT